MRRTRLIERASTGRVVVIEAPSGAGKSTLLRHLADEHDGPLLQVSLAGASTGPDEFGHRVRESLRRLGLSDLLVAIAGQSDLDLAATLTQWSSLHEERLVLQIDDVHRADGDLRRLLGELCDRWPRPHRLVLAGRTVPSELRGVLLEADALAISADDLRFSPQELRELLGPQLSAALSDHDVALIIERCEGWAAAVSLAHDRLQRAERQDVARVVAELASPPSTVRDLLQDRLATCAPSLAAGIRQLTLLPLLDDDLTQLAGIEGGIGGLVEIGIPLDRHGDGWWTVPDVIHDALAPAAHDEQLARAAARHYLDVGAVPAALEVLVAAGLREDLAKCLVDLPPSSIGEIDVAALAAAVAALPSPLLAAHPRILVLLADAYTLVGRRDAVAETLQRAHRVVAGRPAPRGEPASETLDVRAAVLAHRVATQDDDQLIAEAEALLDQAALPPMGRARLTVALGRATARRGTTAALQAAARRFEEAASAFQQVGAPVHAVATQVIAVTDALLPLGRSRSAIALLDQALATARSNVTVRASTLPYRAFALIDLGRYAEAAAHLHELRQVAAATGSENERGGIYGLWATARMASQRGDAETTWAAWQAIERSDALAGAQAVSFRADAAQLLARVGWVDAASGLLQDVRDHGHGHAPAIDVAAFVVAAYAGDRGAAEAALARLDGGRRAAPRDRWRITLLHAHLLHRDGDGSAAALAAAAFEGAARLGHAQLPLIQEPRIAEGLLPLASSGSASARDVAERLGPRLRVLGSLDVEVSGRRTEPIGRQAQLLAHLALWDGRSSVEQLIEALWPGDDPTRGRQRLRTVLRRVRREHGDLVERHGDILRLRSTVTVDVDDFLAFCRTALDPAPASPRSSADRAAAAAAALELYRGEAVPELAGLAWVEDARRHLEEQALAMHDVVAEVAAGDERLDAAIRVLLAALAIDPISEPRYLAAARLLAEQGRRARALRLLEEAREALRGAGLTPTQELQRLADYLARDPVTR